MGLANYFIKNAADTRARDASMIIIGKYRFSILTERLIRIEYNASGTFEDRATSRVMCRTFDKPNFSITDLPLVFTITTPYFTLTFNKKKGSIKDSLNVKLNDTDKNWFYGHPEARNFGGLNVSLDDFKLPLKSEKGLYSTDGFATIDDSKSLVLENDEYIKRPDGIVDLYLFMYRKDLGLCLKDYYTLTGMPTLVPRYSLGNWWMKNESYNNQAIKDLVEDFKFHDIPLEVLLLSSKWHSKNANYLFDPSLLNPTWLSSYLKSQDIKLGITLGPDFHVTPSDPSYNDVTKYIRPNKDGNVNLLPLTTTTLGIYFKLYIKYLQDLGVDFFNIDYKEDLMTLWQLCHYHFAHSDETEAKRGLILARNSLVAPHRYPITFSGRTKVNWDTLSIIPFYNLSSSNIGTSFVANPAGGYYLGTEDEELYMRYVEMSTFSPVMILASEGGKYYKREPWTLSMGKRRIISDYLRLRHKLIPYIYSESYIYHKTGAPLVQPLYYRYPKVYDEPAYRNEYFFGSQFFIAPITKKKDLIINRVVQRVFIPDGMWYDFKTGKKYPGGNYYLSFIKDEEYPVFCKAGGIIPLSNNYLNTSLPTDMEIHIFPGASNSYRLFEDDGITNLFEQNYYLLTSIEYNYLANNYTVIIRPLEGKTGIAPPERNYKIRFRNTKEAEDVICYMNETQIEFNKYIEENDFIVEVKNISTLGQLTINCKGKDIEIDAVRLINEDISSILNDLMIETRLKERLDTILFSNLSIKKKRIEIRKLRREKLEPKYIKMFIKLLEYMSEL